MTIATKSGVPIIQGGRIATACSCCTPCLPIEERTFVGQQYGDNIYTISVPPQAGQFTFTNVQCGGATGAGATCINWPVTYRVKAGGVVLHEAGCVDQNIVLCKPEGVTSIEVNIFVHKPTGQYEYCLGQITFPRGLARIGCLDTSAGACCNGTTCSVKPQCQCNAAAGEVFKGVGTVCSPNPCVPCGCPDTFQLPQSVTFQYEIVECEVQCDFPANYSCPGYATAPAALKSLVNSVSVTAPVQKVPVSPPQQDLVTAHSFVQSAGDSFSLLVGDCPSSSQYGMLRHSFGVLFTCSPVSAWYLRGRQFQGDNTNNLHQVLLQNETAFCGVNGMARYPYRFQFFPSGSFVDPICTNGVATGYRTPETPFYYQVPLGGAVCGSLSKVSVPVPRSFAQLNVGFTGSACQPSIWAINIIVTEAYLHITPNYANPLP